MRGATAALAGRTVYLAGPMRGFPRYNFDAFAVCAAELRRRGVGVVSPAEMDEDLGFDPDRPMEEQGFDYEECLRRDFDAIATVDAVVFMEGSRFSAGALAEYEVAKALGLPVYALRERPGGARRRWVLEGLSYAQADAMAATGRALRAVS